MNQQVNDMAARQLSAMAAVRNTLGDVVIDDEAIEGALVVHNFDVETAVAHLCCPQEPWLFAFAKGWLLAAEVRDKPPPHNGLSGCAGPASF